MGAGWFGRRRHAEAISPERLLPGLTDGAAAVAAARRRVEELAPLPLPGQGTWQRWRSFAEVAERDLSIARLVEGHFDAVAILDELGSPAPEGLLGVWAARPDEVAAVLTDRGWRLSGSKPFCSGSNLLDHALVTATTPDGPGLFLVDARLPVPVAGSWEPLGMYATRSETLRFAGTLVPHQRRIGGVDAYVGRPGFWVGGCGVAACWWGGLRSVLADLEASAGDDDEVAGIRTLEREVAATLLAAAEVIDRSPIDAATAARLAGQTRDVAASAGHRCLAVATARLGTSALAQRAVSQRVADLTMYLTQHKVVRSEAPLAVERC